MSQAIINTPGVPSGESFSPSKSHWAAVIVGVAIASVLGYGSALVATGHLPWVGHQVEIPLTAEATPAAQAGVVSSGVVDGPFETNIATAAAPAAAGVVDGMSREMVTHSALDAFELRSALAAIEVGSGSIAPHSALDGFELRSALAAIEVGSGSIVPHSALDGFELRSALAAIEVGSGSIVPHSALDPSELRNDMESGTDTGSGAIQRSGTGYPRPAFE